MGSYQQHGARAEVLCAALPLLPVHEQVSLLAGRLRGRLRLPLHKDVVRALPTHVRESQYMRRFLENDQTWYTSARGVHLNLDIHGMSSSQLVDELEAQSRFAATRINFIWNMRRARALEPGKYVHIARRLTHASGWSESAVREFENASRLPFPANTYSLNCATFPVDGGVDITELSRQVKLIAETAGVTSLGVRDMVSEYLGIAAGYLNPLTPEYAALSLRTARAQISTNTWHAYHVDALPTADTPLNDDWLDRPWNMHSRSHDSLTQSAAIRYWITEYDLAQGERWQLVADAISPELTRREVRDIAIAL